jgi:hypothetical protein
MALPAACRDTGCNVVPACHADRCVLRLGINHFKVSPGETLAVRVPFSIYLGWITVPMIANISDVLDSLKWNRFGISDVTWKVTMLGAVVLISGLMSFLRKGIACTLVILWALAGIAAQFPAEGVVNVPVWVTFGLVGVTLVAVLVLKRRKKAFIHMKAFDYQEPWSLISHSNSFIAQCALEVVDYKDLTNEEELILLLVAVPVHYCYTSVIVLHSVNI